MNSVFFALVTLLLVQGSRSCGSRKTEICEEPYVRTVSAISDLKGILQKDFYGQHIAQHMVVAALTEHLQDDNPEKPLVMSFHGSAGLGKSFLSRLILNSLFQNGVHNKFVRFYSAARHFRDPRNVREYQAKIETEIFELISECNRAIFIFDEVDMIPSKVLDSLVPFLDRDEVVPGQNRAVYIFLSNQGAEAIADITKKALDEKKSREKLTFKDFEDAIRNEVFNAKKGGLKKAKIIQKYLVDHFIPFLPMERRHVVQCVKSDIAKLGYPVDAEAVADTLTYWPRDTKLFSVAGCKPVEKAVKIHAGENPFKNSNKKAEL